MRDAAVQRCCLLSSTHNQEGCLSPSTLLQVLPAQRQTLLFSATMTRTLTELQSQLLTDAYHFQVRQALQQRRTAAAPGTTLCSLVVAWLSLLSAVGQQAAGGAAADASATFFSEPACPPWNHRHKHKP